jgi:predicted RNA-binding Zn ribbon-like protein
VEPAHNRLAFQFIGGNPALDLINTVDWTSLGPREERLGNFRRLSDWAKDAGLVPPRHATRLRRIAETRPQDAESTYRRAVRTREVLRRLFRSVATGNPDSEALREFNHRLGQALEQMKIVGVKPARDAGNRFELGWKEGEARLDSLLWPVLWSAASLLTSAEVSQIRICDGPDCGWMYVDRSRNGFRRWCQMETCGTREKSRRRKRVSR